MKIQTKLLTCILIYFLSINLTKAQSTINEITNEFFKVYEKNPQKAVDYIFSTNNWMSKEKNYDVENVKSQLSNFIGLVGNYYGFEKITEKSLGESLKLVSYIIKYDRQPIRFTFLFYKPKDVWKIQNFKFDDNLDAEIEEIILAAQQLLNEMDIEEEIEEDEVLVVLKHIQRLDPLGIGSRNLAECLKVQLEFLPKDVEYLNEAKNLLQYYELLIANDLNKLLKQTGLTKDQLKFAINLLKTLKPYPGMDFDKQESDYQIPDVVVSKKDLHWQVQLNPDVLPKLRINSFYSSMIRRADQSEDNLYLRNQMLEAKNFIKSIDERHKTLLKVASCIVEHQKAFLEIGPEAMKPLVLRDVAEEVELHESTVSRVTTNKYMLTPRGLFELKYFFSSHVGTTAGGEASSTAIRAMIKKLVANENPRKPLSDNVIATLLKDEGIEVARRTVAKYRESLHIPSSSERKVLI